MAVLFLAGAGCVAALPSASPVPQGAAAVALALGLLTAPLFPMAAFRASPLPMPFLPAGRMELAGGGGDISQAQIHTGTMRADRIVTGLVAGSASTAVAAAVLLALLPGWAPAALVGCGGLALLLRARHHRGLAQRLWLYGSGLTLVGLLAYSYTVHSGLTGRLIVAAVLLCLAVFAAGLSSPSNQGRPASPRLGRLVDLAEVLVVVALAPLALQVLGVYALVRTFGG
jgi:type VII secretion integral membrane protein EccD